MSDPQRAAVAISSSQAWTTSTTVSASVTVSLRSTPRETSVVRRIWTRRGDEDPGSAQARMISSPVRILLTSNRYGAALPKRYVFRVF